MRPCCEALERVSRTEDGRAVLEERGTGGVLLATIRFGGDMIAIFLCPTLISSILRPKFLGAAFNHCVKPPVQPAGTGVGRNSFREHCPVY